MEGKNVKKIGKFCALVIMGMFVLMMLPMSAVAPPPPSALPFWGLAGNDAGPDDFLGTTNDEDLRIVTNGEQKMVITSGGNVGIGIEVPTEQLDVNGNIRASEHFIAGTTTMYGDGFIDLSDGTNLNIDSDTLFIDNANDRVGLGTTNPEAKLDVECEDITWPPGPGSVGGAATIGHSSNTATGDYAIAMGYDTHAIGSGSTAIGSSTNAIGSSSIAMGSLTSATGVTSTAMGWSTEASGHYASTTMGCYSKARGYWGSTAMGYGTTANGWYGSVAMGSGSTTNGWWGSIAMGAGTTASGSHGSIAMGTGTTAGGNYGSTAMGYMTTADGNYGSIAMGYNTLASGRSSTAIGNTIEVSGQNSVGIGLAYDSTPPEISQSNTMAILGGYVGIGTVSPTYKLHVIGDFGFSGTLREGTIPWSRVNGFNGDSTPDTIADDGKITLGTETIGSYDSTPDTIADDGEISDAEASDVLTINNGLLYAPTSGKVGIGTTSPGAKLDVEVSSGGAATIGYSSNSATGNYAIAMGAETIADGQASTAMGGGTHAQGIKSTAMGDGTYAGALASTAMGYYTEATGSCSFAAGYESIAEGTISTAIGMRAKAFKEASIAIGRGVTADGFASVALGHSITVEGKFSFGIGLDGTTRTITEQNTMAIMGGNVGIGTTSPTGKLEVVGDIVVSGTVDGVDIDVEVDALHTADTLLQSNLDTEISERMAEDAELQANIDALAALDAADYDSLEDIEAAVANGFDIARISGNVGIGTTSPSHKLTIKETYSDNTLRLIGPDGYGLGYGARINFGDGDFAYIEEDLDDKLYIHASQRTAIMGGNVGIGTTNPGEKLEVVGNVKVKGDVTLTKSGGVGGGELVLSTSVYNEPGRYRIRFANNAVAPFVGDDNEDQSYNFYTTWSKDRTYDAHIRAYGRSENYWGNYIEITHDGADGIIKTDRGDILLNPSGNVGIGTTNAHNPIDLGSSHGKKLAVYQNTAGTDFYGLGISSSTLEIHAGNDGTENPGMVLNEWGRVGIGTINPRVSLDINDDEIRIRQSYTPPSMVSTGYKGEICWDSSYIYVCIAGDGPGGNADIWQRAALGGAW
jgi:hypothetical protein